MVEVANLTEFALGLGAGSVRINPAEPIGRAENLSNLLSPKGLVILARNFVRLHITIVASFPHHCHYHSS